MHVLVCVCVCVCVFVGFALLGKKDIVFRFIIEYSSLRDFGPYVIIIMFRFIIEYSSLRDFGP